MRASHHRPLIAALVACALATCSNSTGPSYDYPEVVLTHNGFDFSVGAPDTIDYSNSDGDVIVWQPARGNPDNPQYSDRTYVWWRNDQTTADNTNATKDMGEVAIAKVKDVPTAWDVSPTIPPLLVGHTVVAKCRDGHAKFEVIATDTVHWAATVKYYFTTGSTFDE